MVHWEILSPNKQSFQVEEITHVENAAFFTSSIWNLFPTLIHYGRKPVPYSGSLQCHSEDSSLLLLCSMAVLSYAFTFLLEFF